MWHLNVESGGVTSRWNLYSVVTRDISFLGGFVPPFFGEDVHVIRGNKGCLWGSTFTFFNFSLSHYCCVLSHTSLRLELFFWRCWWLVFGLGQRTSQSDRRHSPVTCRDTSVRDDHGTQDLLNRHIRSWVPDHWIVDTSCPFRLSIGHRCIDKMVKRCLLDDKELFENVNSIQGQRQVNTTRILMTCEDSIDFIGSPYTYGRFGSPPGHLQTRCCTPDPVGPSQPWSYRHFQFDPYGDHFQTCPCSVGHHIHKIKCELHWKSHTDTFLEWRSSSSCRFKKTRSGLRHWITGGYTLIVQIWLSLCPFLETPQVSFHSFSSIPFL